MTRILGEHCNFNRILFGDSLWTFITHPSIVHGCVVWLYSEISSAQNNEGLQYQAGKKYFENENELSKI